MFDRKAIRIGPDHPSYRFAASEQPRAIVNPGQPVEFVCSADAYRGLTSTDLDDPGVQLDQLNALSGPVLVEGCQSGDALGVTIQAIDLDSMAFLPVVARWRGQSFGFTSSTLLDFPVSNGVIGLSNGGRLPCRPMVGCLGVAPATASVSSLSPTARTGGNLDLVEAGLGATIWFPVEVPGALFSLGDIHARMARGEPVRAGMECGGKVTVSFRIAAQRPIAGPRIETDHSIHFVGTDPKRSTVAELSAVVAAWTWLTVDCAVDRDLGLAICAALLNLNFGGPAGNNVVASFDLNDLQDAGVKPSLLREPK